MGIVNRDGALWMATGIDNSGLYSGFNQAENRVDQFEAHIKRMGDNITRLTGIGFGVAGLKAFGSEIINVRGEIQMLESSFEVLLGGKGVSGFMSEMKQFAVDSPLSLSNVGDAAQMLLAFGVEADNVMSVVKQLGDISMGNSAKFQSLALAFSQMTSAGRVLSQDLRQMATAGFNPLGEIARTTGKSIQEVTKMMDDGQITVQQVSAAFASATAEGGKFYGMTQKQAEGIRGLQAQLEGALQDAFNEIGKSQEGLIAGGYKAATSLVENYDKVGKAIVALIATYGVYKAAMVFDTGLKKAVDTVKYTEEAKALEDLAAKNKHLISQEQIATVSKSGLVKGSKEYADALKKEIELAMERSSQDQQYLQNELTSTRNSIKTKEDSIEALRQEIIERETSLKGLKGMTEAENALAAQKELTNLKSKESIAQNAALLAGKEKYAVKAELIASIEANADEKSLNRLRERVKAADDVFEAKTKEWKIAQNNVSAMESEIEAGNKVIAVQKGKSTQTKINNAEKQLNTKYTQLNSLEQERNSLKRVESTAAAKLNSEGMRANSLQTQYNTAVQNANTASTNILTAAKVKLITVAKNLWAALAPNPYVLAAAAVVALGYGIYKLSTAATAAEQAQAALNKETERTTAKAEDERAAIEKLLGIIKDEVSTRKEKQKALETLQTKYPSIFSNLDIEKIKNLDLANAIRQVNIELEKRSGAQAQANIDRAKEILKGISDFDGVTFKTTKDIKDAKDLVGLDGVWERNSITNSKLKKDLEEYVRQAEKELGRVSKSTEEAAGKTAKAGSDQIFDAVKRVTDLNNELKNLNDKIIPADQKDNAGFKFSKAIEDKIKEVKDAENELNLLLYGKSTKEIGEETKSTESTTQKAHKQAQEVADQQDKINQLTSKQSLERKRLDEDLLSQETQAYINAMQSGSAKIKAQRDLDHKLDIQALERQKEDYIQKKVQAEKEIFDAQQELELKKNPKYTKKIFDPSSIKVDTSLFDSIIGDVSAAQLNQGFDEIDKAWNEYFIKFGNYQEKRAAIIQKYNKEIAEAQTGGGKAILQKEMQNTLDELDNSVKNSTTLMGQLFADTSRKSVAEMQKIIDKAELLMQYLEAVKDEQGNANIGGRIVSKQDILDLGISDNTLENLKLSTAEIEALRNAINKLKGDLGSKSPFKLFESQVGGAIAKIKQGGKNNITQGITEISSAISQFAPDVKEFGNSLGTLFGDDKMGENIGHVVDGIEGIGKASAGVAKIMSGDVIGGVMDVVNGAAQAVNAFGSLFGPDGTAYYERIRSQLEAINNIYASLIEKSKEDIVFGGGFASISAASSALDNYYKKVANLQKIADASGRAGAKWNSHSAEWHSNKNVGTSNFAQMSAIIGQSIKSMDDLYYLTGDQLYLLQSQMPEAWGQIDARILENLQSIIDCKDEATELKDALNEALTGVSQDSFYNEFINNLSDMSLSWEDMCDNFEDSLRKSIIAGLVADQYKDRINSLYQSWSDAAKSDNKITESEAERLKNEYQDIVEQMMKDRQNLADSFGWDTSDTTVSSKGIQSVTQDSFDEYLGTAYAQLQKMGDIRNINEASRVLLGGINNGVTDIQAIMRENNKVFQDSLEVYKKIEQNTAKAADILNKIETLGLIIRN